MSATANKFDTWPLVEIMGHQRAAGRVTEATIAGGVMLRIDIPKDAESQEFITQYVNTTSIFRLTPTTEEIVRAALTRYEWRPPQLSLAHIRGHEDLPVRDYGDDDDEECFHDFIGDGSRAAVCRNCGVEEPG